jgi:hypothetical protein
MASVRRIRYRSCTSKIKYESVVKAKVAAYSVCKHTGVDVMVYYCKFCKQWHIGRPTKEKLRGLQDKGIR